MKKQTLLALTAGLAITASGISFATTQNNSLQNGSSNGTTITGYSDQSQDQGTTQGQTTTTTTTKRKVDFSGSINVEKIADAKCANGKCGNGTTNSTDNSKGQNSTTSTSGNDTTTQKS